MTRRECASMRNHAEKWPEVPNWKTDELLGNGVSVKTVPDLKQWMVSGNLAAWNEVSGHSGPGVGALGLTEGETYQVRLARDRLLAVNCQKEISPGWHDAGFALTDMSAAFHIFEFTGPKVSEIVSRATTLDPSNPGRSATTAFAGVVASLYHYEKHDTLRVHVDRGFAPHIWTWVQAQRLFK